MKTTILKKKIQSICSHALHHAHTLIALTILLHAYMCFLVNGFLFFFFLRKASMKKLLLKSNTEGLLFVKENTDKKVLHEILSEKF